MLSRNLNDKINQLQNIWRPSYSYFLIKYVYLNEFAQPVCINQ